MNVREYKNRQRTVNTIDALDVFVKALDVFASVITHDRHVRKDVREKRDRALRIVGRLKDDWKIGIFDAYELEKEIERRAQDVTDLNLSGIDYRYELKKFNDLYDQIIELDRTSSRTSVKVVIRF